jgi:hypothetical protein
MRHPTTLTRVLGFILLMTADAAGAQGEIPPAPLAGARSWDKVQYLGGAVGVRARSPRWDNTLTVGPQTVEIRMRDGTRVEVGIDRIIAITYEGMRWKRQGLLLLFQGPLGAPLADGLTGTAHFIAIEYALPNGGHSAFLLRAHKDNYREILAALHSVIPLEPKPEAPDGKP